MRKRYLLVLIIIILIGFSSVIYYLTLSKPLSGYNEPQNQENGTNPPNILPFRFPWEATQTTTNKSSGGGTGSSGGGSGESGSGESGGSGGEETVEPYYNTKINYALNLDSIPEGLKIFASYYIDNVRHSIISDAPFNLEVDVNSLVCVLPAYVIGNGTLKWTLDEQDCPFSVCETPSYSITETLYSDYGCLISMNSNRSVTLNYTQT